MAESTAPEAHESAQHLDAVEEERRAGESISHAVSELDRTTERLREAVDRAVGQPVPASTTSPASSARAAATPPTSTTGTQPAAAGSAGSAGRLGRSSTLSQAAEALADDLMRIPGIQRFGAMRLEELESAGPRPLRTMWRIARDQLEREYGQLTIGEIIDRHRSGSGGGAGGVSAGA